MSYRLQAQAGVGPLLPSPNLNVYIAVTSASDRLTKTLFGLTVDGIGHNYHVTLKSTGLRKLQGSSNIENVNAQERDKSPAYFQCGHRN